MWHPAQMVLLQRNVLQPLAYRDLLMILVKRIGDPPLSACMYDDEQMDRSIKVPNCALQWPNILCILQGGR